MVVKMNFSKMEKFLDWLVTWRIPGVDCIVIKDGETVFRHMAGYADIEAGREMRGDEIYNMWSCSKPITCAAAMTLYERGDFLLTDPLERYMPEFSEMKIRIKQEDGTSVLVPAKKKILVRDLFSMSAGFDYDIESEPIKAVKKATDGRCPTVETVKAIAKCPLYFEPGTHWLYSLCHDILAGFVEVVSGERFSDYVKHAIFEPLGMTDSTFAAPEQRLLDRMSRQYSFNFDTNKAIPTDNSVTHRLGTEYESGGAGLICSLEDYAKFAYAMANGGVGANGARILSRRTIDLMRTNIMNEDQMKDVNWEQLAGYGYGLGVRTMVSPGAGGSNGPVGEFGWAGAAGSYVMIDPENRLALVYGEHMLNSMETYITPRLRNMLYAALED